MDKIGELLRFGMVGCMAVAIQYGTYLLALRLSEHNAAFIVGYAVSFTFNYVATVLFTFRVKSNKSRMVGFVLSHVVNIALQNVLLNFCIWIGMSKALALLPAFVVCVPVNFLFVRYFMKKEHL